MTRVEVLLAASPPTQQQLRPLDAADGIDTAARLS
jgi:hypothetical protein